MTQYKDDPLLSFHDPNRDHVDLALRYRKGPIEQTEYRHELDRLTAEQLAKRLEEKRGLREFEASRPVRLIYHLKIYKINAKFNNFLSR